MKPNLDEIRARCEAATKDVEKSRKKLGVMHRFEGTAREDRRLLLAEVERLDKQIVKQALGNFNHSEEMQKIHAETFKCRDGWMERARKAEAEVERLREGLEWIVAAADCYNGPVVKIARDTLEGGGHEKK